jgi:opacity protein-like surface antigen
MREQRLLGLTGGTGQSVFGPPWRTVNPSEVNMRDRLSFAARLFLPAVLVAAVPLAAQERAGTVEITPFGGAYIGGTLHRGSNALFDRDVDVKTDVGFGLRVGVNANRWLGIEASFSTAKADIEETSENDLFGGSSRLGELDVKHYELNAVFNMGHKRVIPFLTIGGGATTFDANVPGTHSSTDTRFTLNAGAGLKVFFNPHFGLRFEGRWRGALIDDSDRCDRHDDDCNDNYWNDESDRRWYDSGEVTGGLTIAF